MSTGSFLRRLFGNGGGERRVEDLLSLCQALLAESGEYASMAIARDALDAYRVLDEREREAFFDELVSRYSPAPEAVARAAALYQSNPSPEQLIELQASVEPARQELFRRLNMAPGGTAALVEMRKTLLKGLRAHSAWKVIDFDLMHLLRSWFNRGFLKLERIDWRTPALLLEKLIDYEAVHAIRGWWDLRRFATLSPIPGFRRWLGGAPLSQENRALLARIEDPAWHLGEVPEPLQKLLSRLCAHYLLYAKQGPEPLDAVARFHLGNGAALERLNWMGDSSEQGMSRSAGMMVNYAYWLAELEKNHERYFREHAIAASPAIEKLAREAPLLPAVEQGAA